MSLLRKIFTSPSKTSTSYDTSINLQLVTEVHFLEEVEIQGSEGNLGFEQTLELDASSNSSEWASCLEDLVDGPLQEKIKPIHEEIKSTELAAPSNTSNRASSSFMRCIPEDHGIPPPPPPFPGDAIILGSLLKVCPATTLVFHESIDYESAPVCLTLTNITSNYIAYKLKTNNVGIFQVKRPSGIIKPGEFQNVRLQLTRGSNALILNLCGKIQSTGT
ncbi:uncharacterized protein LOC143227359 [Tachypleus tridentatus]|uniref:uncharacterized protein LOC143227359 n=1 Tax=Tachypleus tridentatus TaxID=6853 RepID=UPI003FD07EB9